MPDADVGTNPGQLPDRHSGGMRASTSSGRASRQVDAGCEILVPRAAGGVQRSGYVEQALAGSDPRLIL